MHKTNSFDFLTDANQKFTKLNESRNRLFWLFVLLINEYRTLLDFVKYEAFPEIGMPSAEVRFATWASKVLGEEASKTKHEAPTAARLGLNAPISLKAS